MKIEKTWPFLMAISIAFLLVTLFKVSQVSADSPRGVMKGAFHHNISADWLDPSITSFSAANYFPLYLLHDALVKPMAGSLYAPCLAESWNVSPDSKVYEFKLRKGVKFHNGDEMTANDVVFTFQRYKGGASKIFQDKIEKLEAVNPYLFRVTFKRPFPDFLEYLLPGASTIAWIVPKRYIEKVGDTEYKRYPIGCGPYTCAEFTSGVKLVGEAFEGFWRKVPKVKRLEVYCVTEISTRYAMATRGEVDWALAMVDVFYERVKKDPNLRLLIGLSATAFTVYITSQWDPKSPWSDPRVRKAASLAIDRKSLVDVHFPGAQALDSLALPGDPEGARFPPDPYDPEKAKKLLAEAGYPHGLRGGTFYPPMGPSQPMGEQIATYWKAVGIDLEIIPLDSSIWTAQRRGGKMKGGIIIDTMIAPTIGARLGYLFGPQSYGNYPDIQALWNQYEQSVDPKVRKDLIMRIQKLIYDKIMFIPLIGVTTPSAVGPRVKGNPFKIREPFPIWWPCPMEDLELND